MANRPTDLRLRIDAFTPETIPMARLAEYMRDFASVLGEESRVHFLAIEDGSAVLRAQVEEEFLQSVNHNIENADDPASNNFKSFEQLDKRLAEDGAIGEIIDFKEQVVLRFLGRERPKPIEFPTFRERGSVDGHLVRIGGKDSTVHATLVDEDISYRCQMNRGLAREIAPYLFGQKLRLFGSGRWRVNSDSEWALEQFDVEHFEILENGSLADSIMRIHGENFSLEDPANIHERLKNLRSDD